MQRQPGYGPNGAPGFNPGMPQPGFGANPGYMAGHRPGPCFGGPPMPMPPQQQGPGCFMPASTIRKLSNTTPPPQFFNPPH